LLSQHIVRRPVIWWTALFVLITASTAAGAFQGMDQATFASLPSSHVKDAVNFGAVWLTAVMCLLLTFTVRAAARARYVLLLACTFAAVAAVEVVCKLIIVQPAGELHGALPLIQSAGSLPSGHAARTAIVSGLMMGVLKPNFRPLPLTVLAVVSWALIGDGHHYLSDVLAGIALGFAAAAFMISSVTLNVKVGR
jgi:membrane-associated phospholipid phosphatase